MTQATYNEFNEVLQNIFKKNQLALPSEDRCGSGWPPCMMRNDSYLCTKIINHTGDHCAHGTLGTILRRWP